MIQTDLAFGGFKPGFNGSPLAGYADHLIQGGRGWRKDEVIRQVCGVTHTPPEQNPPLPVCGYGRVRDLHSGPIVEPGTFAAIPATESGPRRLAQGSRDGIHSSRFFPQAHGLFDRDRQHIGLSLRL